LFISRGLFLYIYFIMPRPRSFRRIDFDPKVTIFKPQGVPLRMLEFVDLSHEELEVLRLKNILGLDQNTCAERMNTSQSTIQRILNSAYKKISLALINGKGIKIHLKD